MQRLRTAIQPYLGTKAYYRGALAVMLPVTVQQLINNLFNMVDNLMVGSLDVQGLAISAVSVANMPVMVFNGFIFGLVGGGGLLISQYYGAKDRRSCQGIFWLQMAIALVNATVFFLVLYLFPENVMRIYVSDPYTVALGVSYLRIIAFSYFPAAISGACIFSLRSLGQNRVPMLASMISMGVNVVCNYALIYGNFGMPKLGVVGAAYGTLIARLFEMGFYTLLMMRERMYFHFAPLDGFRLEKRVRSQFIQKAAPMIVNEMLYGLGLNIFFWCYAKLAESALPALTIAELATQISAVIITGGSSAISVLIGTALGAGELDKARDHCKKLSLLTFLISLVSMTLCMGIAFILPQFYSIQAELRSLATELSCILALFLPANFMYSFCFFVLRAGGDMRNAMLLDSGYMWFVPVPASVLMALLLPGRLSLVPALIIVQVLMNAKLLWAVRAVRKGTWVRNLTLEQP
ncbi:MAG: MATE family efflux transporter [Candidatus Limiplasma sp.]|nr:MATE family efflux transporter [Candidatus Limiplasma sp.]MEA5144546.1 MATE family efflux transporter [Candidatus Limiplasma sp.]